MELGLQPEDPSGQRADRPGLEDLDDPTLRALNLSRLDGGEGGAQLLHDRTGGLGAVGEGDGDVVVHDMAYGADDGSGAAWCLMNRICFTFLERGHG